MSITRPVYRKTRIHNGPTVVPLNLVAGLVEDATPALAYRIALGDAQCPGRSWEQQMWASHRCPPSRSTLERIAKKIGAAVKASASPILAQVRREENLGEQAHAICLGLDRTTIPMEEPLRAGDTRDPALRKRKKPYVRRAPAPVEVKYRMGYVGTVSVMDRDGDCVRTLKYACAANEDPEVEIQKMLSDVRHLLHERHATGAPPPRLAIVQDGAPEMWNLLEGGLRQGLPGVPYDKAIDRYHLDERLSEALRLLRVPVGKRGSLLARWKRLLNDEDAGIETVEAELTRTIRKYSSPRLSAEDASVIAGTQTYLRTNKRRMRYATLRRQGLPVGSGATEGACKSTIMIRAKGCGQRWHTRGVSAVLELRALYMSDRLPAAWSAFQQLRHATVQAA